MQMIRILGKRDAIWVAAGVLVALLIFPDATCAQCAMCRTTLLNSAEGQRLIGAFDRSIFFLLSAPFAVFGIIGGLIVKGYRRQALRAGRSVGELPLPVLTATPEAENRRESAARPTLPLRPRKLPIRLPY